VNLSFEVDEKDLISKLVNDFDADLVKFVVELDEYVADAEFTEEVIIKLYSALVKEYSSDELESLNQQLTNVVNKES